VAKAKVELPNLSNATPTYLADEIGAMRKEKKRLETLEAFFMQALKARKGDDKIVKGEKFELEFQSITQYRLDNEKVRELLTEDQLSECTKEVTFEQAKSREL
jgi:hypothetical protein